jgi:hypothetical protein
LDYEGTQVPNQKEKEQKKSEGIRKYFGSGYR